MLNPIFPGALVRWYGPEGNALGRVRSITRFRLVHMAPGGTTPHRVTVRFHMRNGRPCKPFFRSLLVERLSDPYPPDELLKSGTNGATEDELPF